jgi:mannose/cellobiose epimerase-like protein (N-acyl-D-glucosamine 2-epimerase family)
LAIARIARLLPLVEITDYGFALHPPLALQTYNYILHHLVDYNHGEWYWAILPDGSIDQENDKAGLWKCPYHNSRMCFEIIERL